jgi:hypothetical protein
MPDQLVPVVTFLRAILPVINTVLGSVWVTLGLYKVPVPLWLALVGGAINALALYGGSEAAQKRYRIKKLSTAMRKAGEDATAMAGPYLTTPEAQAECDRQYKAGVAASVNTPKGTNP